ncbi:MAG TPA: ABC transporter ATP-binding protein [Limnochordales bacterium]
MPKLLVENLSKSYVQKGQRLPVLDGISFAAEPGAFVAIVGPSGCGKSTLMDIICGLQPADAGVVTVDGRPVTGPGHVAYMPQEDLLFPWRRLIDNVIVPLQLKGMPRHAAREQARRWLPFFGLDGFADAYPSQLSGGMRQRAALLRTFLTERDIIALDEPFGALDAHTRRRMQAWLADVHRQMGRTVLMITHDVEEALVLADRVVVLGPRPARVVYTTDVDLPRPRDILSTAFAAYKGAVLAHLGFGNLDGPALATSADPVEDPIEHPMPHPPEHPRVRLVAPPPQPAAPGGPRGH